MNKTVKELLIFLVFVLITVGVGYGIIELFKFNKARVIEKKELNEKLNVSWELKLRDLIKRQIELEENILYDAKINKAIDIIKKRFETNLEDNPYKIEIAVIDSPVVNAAAFPGGFIVIFSGLIKLSDSPEEIASVVAHEMGHVIHRDSVNALKKQFGLAILFSIITGGDPNIIDQMIRNVLSNRFSQNMEKNADDFAHELLIKSGLSPIHFADMFKKMQAQYDENVDKRIIKYLGTHPDIDSRIERAESMAELFRGEEELFDIDWKEAKKSLPSIFD